ncbi:MAG TPA: LysR family transcriptional regulator [Azospirillaceae bacterium]|nr:LysR family transcriptional regulator [Azospirillaceae bacterium]
MAAIEPDWSDLRIFLAVAEAGSLTGAAARLRLSQPTVGRRLKALEEAVGGPLFERLPNRLEPTALARDLAQLAARMREGADAVRRRLDRPDEAGRALVRVSATSSVSLFLTRHLHRLAAECPGVELALLPTRSRANLGRREAEIAVRMRRPPAEGDMVVRRLGRFGFALYATEPLAAPHRRPDGTVDLAALDHIGIGVDERPSAKAEWMDRTVPPARSVARLGEMHLRHQAARDGVGAALLPCFVGDADPGLVRLLPPPDELAEDMFLLMHADLKDRPPVRAAADALVRLFRAEERRLAGG